MLPHCARNHGDVDDDDDDDDVDANGYSVDHGSCYAIWLDMAGRVFICAPILNGHTGL